MKKHLLTLLKFTIPVAIIAWLLSSIDPQQWTSLQNRPKDWDRLSLAFGVCLLAVCTTFVRWHLLVWALEIPFRVRDAFRLGFLGFLFNFVGIGSVGGDLFKAVFIAREQPGRRTEAIATVVADRVIGLFGLLLVASIAILVAGIPKTPTALAVICFSTLGVAATATVSVLVVLIPGFTLGSLSEIATRLPKVGSTVERLVISIRMYRKRLGVLAAALALSMAVHVLLTVSIYLIAGGLFGDAPTLGEHMVIVPLSNVAGGVPFMPGGLGTFEFAMEKLYVFVPATALRDGFGVLVAFGYRLTTVGIAAVGIVYYWTSRREVRELLQAAEADREST